MANNIFSLHTKVPCFMNNPSGCMDKYICLHCGATEKKEVEWKVLHLDKRNGAVHVLALFFAHKRHCSDVAWSRFLRTSDIAAMPCGLYYCTQTASQRCRLFACVRTNDSGRCRGFSYNLFIVQIESFASMHASMLL